MNIRLNVQFWPITNFIVWKCSNKLLLSSFLLILHQNGYRNLPLNRSKYTEHGFWPKYKMLPIGNYLYAIVEVLHSFCSHPSPKNRDGSHNIFAEYTGAEVWSAWGFPFWFYGWNGNFYLFFYKILKIDIFESW